MKILNVETNQVLEVKELAAKLRVDARKIYDATRKGRPINGVLYKRIENDMSSTPTRQYTIICLDKDIKFNSLNDAVLWAKDASGKNIDGMNILKSCFGITQTSAGFVWSIDCEDDKVLAELARCLDQAVDEEYRIKGILLDALNKMYEELN